MANTGVERAVFSDTMAVLLALGLAVVGLLYGFISPDPAMSFHGFIFAAGSAFAAYYVVSNMSGTAAASGRGPFSNPP